MFAPLDKRDGASETVKLEELQPWPTLLFFREYLSDDTVDMVLKAAYEEGLQKARDVQQEKSQSRKQGRLGLNQARGRSQRRGIPTTDRDSSQESVASDGDSTAGYEYDKDPGDIEEVVEDIFIQTVL
jgi:hypothetical protein